MEARQVGRLPTIQASPGLTIKQLTDNQLTVYNDYVSKNQGMIDLLSRQQGDIEQQFLSQLSICPVLSLQRSQVALGGLPALKPIIDQRFYDSQLMSYIFCAVNGIFYQTPGSNIKSNQRIKFWINNLRRFTTTGVNSVISSGDLRYNSSDLFIVKTAKHQHSDVAHEAFVGIYLNQLRQEIPNFVYTLGWFKCGDPVAEESETQNILISSTPISAGKTITYCLNESGQYLL